MTLKKNDIVNLTITSATAEGSGVGRTDDGIAVFVQGSAIGDELKVRILKVKKTYAFGKIEEILVPSKARITPDCENFMKCGGCTWRHISYEEEGKIKQQRVEDAVTRIGGLDNVVFKPIISSDNITRYRNKAQYPVGLDRDGNVVTGFYSFHSHRIINCTDCILQPEIFASVIEITKDFIAKTNTEIYDETMDIQMEIESKTARDLRSYNEQEQEILFPRECEFEIVKRKGNRLWLKEI